MPLWKFPVRKRVLDKQFDSELRFHADELTKEYIAEGMAPEEARRRTALEFGGSEQIKEELRDLHRVPVLETMLNNSKWALRLITKSPSFSIVVILTLALGIGANSAVFSAINAILLRPLPFPNGDQLMSLHQYSIRVKSPQTELSTLRLEDWNRMNSTFQAIAGYYTENSSETSGALPEKVTEAFVTPRFLRVLGVSPALGRDFSPEEEHFGGPNAVLISDRFWRRRFAADPNALGKKVRINGYSDSIVGIMPASFGFPYRDVDIWSSVPTDAPFAQDRGSTWYLTIGRLKPAVSLAQARVDLAAVQARLGKQYSKTDTGLAVAIEPLKETTIGGVRSSLWMLFGSVSLLLLIACTNIVTLLLARAAQRQREISVRFSLGAPRSAVVAQLLTEIFVLALAGALLGLIVAGGASKVFRVLAGSLPRVEEIHLDTKIVAYSLLCSVVATILCGVWPALRATRKNLLRSLAQNSRSQVSGGTPLQWLLVGTQVALAVTLLAGAGLLLRSFQALGRVSPGFEASHILTFHVSANWGETTDMAALTQRINRTLDRLRSVPGVEAAATSGALPGVPSEFHTDLRFAEGERDPEHKITAESRFVSPDYFATTQIPLLAGDLCREPKFLPSPNSPGRVRLEANSINVVVNRRFADTYLPGSNIIGRHLQVLGNAFLQPDDAGEIRGIVGDAREEGLNRISGPTVYWCINDPSPDPYYLLRTHTEPMALAETVRKEIHDIEPARSVFDIMPLEEHLDDAFAENRLRTILLTFFAVTAVSLTYIGLFGTLSYSVTLRRREISLRLALGALQGQIVKHFLLQGLAVTFLGCVAGWGLASASGRVLSGMLYGVSPSDAVTLSTVVLLMLLIAASAALVPAIRASRVDPMHVLREE
jgi:putative ABC transport system permease protein